MRLAQCALLAIVLPLTLLSGPSLGQIEAPQADPRAAILIRAQAFNRWRTGAYDVWHLRGNCELRQANVSTRGNEAVLWIETAAPHSGQPDKIIAYFEGDVSVDRAHGGQRHMASGRSADSIVGNSWFGRFYTMAGIKTQLPSAGGPPNVAPAVYQRGMQVRQADRQPVRSAQFTEPLPPPGAAAGGLRGARQITVTPRSSAPIQAKTFNNPDRNEQIAVIDQGVRLVVEGLQDDRFAGLDKIDVEADRIVIWTSGMEGFSFLGEQAQQDDRPLEFYMEGNVVFRQGDRVIYAERMYYNATNESGTILNAEILTPVPSYQGLLRLKADVVQQIDKENFLAQGAALTSSRLGIPRYWFQAENVSMQDRQVPRTEFFSGQPVIDPFTGEQEVDHQMLATATNNFVYTGGFPVFYWPILATDLNNPSYYVNRVAVNNDNILGTQFLVDFDLYQLLGIRNRPVGTDLELSIDYFTERGFAAGTNFKYQRTDFFGITGPSIGFIDLWGIDDKGLDTLGADRLALVPEQQQRGRILGRHRQEFPVGMQITGELGLISDRNFLEQYYEREWDELKDQTTGIMLRQAWNNWSWNVLADVRLNEFFTQTEWLPRGDHFLLGQPLLFNRLTWNAHTHAGYARLRTATAPLDPTDAAKFDPLAWEVASSGVRAGTRQEFALPLKLGPTKVVPYVLGDASYWGSDLAGTDVTRLYGQVGVRNTLPIWKVNRDVQSELFNVNGIAHKVVFASDFFWADANEDLGRFPLYDPLDDDSQEFFRRRFFFDTYGGAPGGNVPLRFDERFYALRTGMQGSVTAPSLEIADDLLVSRMGVHQRWQTKRGPPGNERIIDWIVLDVEGSVFPAPRPRQFRREYRPAELRLPLACRRPADFALRRLCRCVQRRPAYCFDRRHADPARIRQLVSWLSHVRGTVYQQHS